MPQPPESGLKKEKPLEYIILFFFFTARRDSIAEVTKIRIPDHGTVIE